MPVNLGSAYGKIILDASGVATGVREAQGMLGGLTSSMASIGTSLTKSVTLPLVGVGVAAAKTGGDFEGQMATLSVAARSSGTSLEELRNVALKTGADTKLVGISASQSAEAMENFYKAGLDTTEIFGDMNGYMEDSVELGYALRSAIDLAAASDLNLAQASEAVAISMATFNLNAEDAVDIANNLVQAADASVTEVGELTQALVNVGPTAASFGWRIEEVNTALAILSERGIRGGEAGTALKSMMTNLMRPTDDVTEALGELNVSLYDTDGRMRSLPEILTQLEIGLAGVTEEERNMYIQTLAGTYGMKALHTLLAEGTQGWGEMEVAIEGAATAQDVAAVKADTFKGSVEALMGTVETFLIQASTPLINDFLRPAVEGLTKLFEAFVKLPDPIKNTAVVIGIMAAAMGPALRIGGGLVGMFGNLAGGAVSLGQALIGLPGFLTNVFAGLKLLWGSGVTGAFGVASTGAAGLTAALIPLTIGIGALVAMYLKWRDVQNEVKDGMRETEGAIDEWSAYVTDAKNEGEDLADVMEELGGKVNTAKQAWEESNWAAKQFIDIKKIQQSAAARAHQIILREADTFEEYTRLVKAYNSTAGDSNAMIREQTYAFGAMGAKMPTISKEQEKINEAQFENWQQGKLWVRSLFQQADAWARATGKIAGYSDKARDASDATEEVFVAIDNLNAQAARGIPIMESYSDEYVMIGGAATKVSDLFEYHIAPWVKQVTDEFDSGKISLDEYCEKLEELGVDDEVIASIRETQEEYKRLADEAEEAAARQKAAAEDVSRGLAGLMGSMKDVTETALKQKILAMVDPGENLQAWVALGRELGLLSEEQINLALGADALVNAFENEQISAENMGGAIGELWKRRKEEGLAVKGLISDYGLVPDIIGKARDQIQGISDDLGGQADVIPDVESGLGRVGNTLKNTMSAYIQSSEAAAFLKKRLREDWLLEKKEAELAGEAYDTMGSSLGGLGRPAGEAAQGVERLLRPTEASTGAMDDSAKAVSGYNTKIERMEGLLPGAETGVRNFGGAASESVSGIDPAAESTDTLNQKAERVPGLTRAAGVGIGTMGSAARGAAGPVGALTSQLGGLGSTIRSIPDSKTITITVNIVKKGEIPEEEETPLVGGRQRGAWRIPKMELSLLHPGEMVVPAQEAELLRQWITAMVRPATVMAPAHAMVGGRGRGSAAEQQPINVNFYNTQVGNEVDIEVMAYRVATEIQRKQR